MMRSSRGTPLREHDRRTTGCQPQPAIPGRSLKTPIVPQRGRSQRWNETTVSNRRRTASLVLLAAVGLGLGSHAAARQGESPEAVRLPASMPLTDLVELISKRLGVSVQYEKEVLAKPVTVRLNEPVDDEELWRVLRAVLTAQNQAIIATEQPGLYRILPLASAAAETRPRMLDSLSTDTLDDRASFVSVILRPHGQDPQGLARDLAPLLTPSIGSMKPFGESGLLLVSDLTTKVRDIVSLIASLESGPDPVTRFIVPLTNSSATDMARAIEQVQLSGGAVPSSGAAAATGAGPAPTSTGSRQVRVVALPDEQRILVVAPASRERELRTLIEELDARQSRHTRGYAVAGVDPVQLAASLRLLLSGERSGGASTAASAAAARGGAWVEPDLLTGSVLMSATETEHERAAAFVDELRVAGAANRRVLKSFVIRNRDASEVRDTLAELLNIDSGDLDASGETGPVLSSSGISMSGTPRSGVFPPTSPLPASLTSETTGGPVAGPGLDGPSGTGLTPRHLAAVQLTVDKATNAIIASGDPATIAQLGSLIAELDQRQPQVMIEVSIVTLDDSEALSFGVELRKRFENGDTTTNLASLFGLAASDALGAGTGFTGTVLRPGDYEIVVRALENVSEGRTLSMPKVLVNNNATATVRSVRREPFTSINASNTVSTTSFGGTQDAGTTITVEPRIARGDHLVLKYNVELSAFTGAPTTTQDGGIIPPPSQQNSVEGDITLPDGHTVVVGGLDNLTQGTSSSRVPLLGRIPILGALFGTTNDTDQKARFFVFIRATVLRDPAFRDLARLSAPDLSDAGVATGSPTLTPKWVE